MDNFNYTNKDTYTKEELANLLTQHENFVSKKTKNTLEPIINEYKEKLSTYEEKELFNGLNEKQAKLAKSLINTEFKELTKQEALLKVKEEYKELFTFKENKAEVKSQQVDPTKLILDLHNNSIDPDLLDKKLKEKARTTGITTQEETERLINLARGNALKNIK